MSSVETSVVDSLIGLEVGSDMGLEVGSEVSLVVGRSCALSNAESLARRVGFFRDLSVLEVSSVQRAHWWRASAASE